MPSAKVSRAIGGTSDAATHPMELPVGQKADQGFNHDPLPAQPVGRGSNGSLPTGEFRMEEPMGQEYSELRARIAALGMNQSSLARTMKELGDDRDEKNILRSIQRMVAGDARVSGEMRALLGLLERTKS
jgi:hypothetical protein